jgi:two-component system sensor histidine kinase BaeS
MPEAHEPRPDEGEPGGWSRGAARHDARRPGWGRPAGRWSGDGWHGPTPGRWRGFGCLFALLFLVVAGSLVAASAVVVSQLGPVPGLVTLGLVIVALVAMGRTLRSTGATLDELVEATRRVETGDYSVRVGPGRRGLRGVRELVRGFDTMTSRLETDERQRRTLLADVSHELRTPLTVVQGNLEAILDGVYPPDPAHLGPILDETRVLSRLIDDLRTLALSEAGTLALHPEPTDPDILIADVVRSFEPAAAAAGVGLSAVIEGDLPILEIDPVRMHEVLANLVANALRHTPAGGRVTVAGSVEGRRWVRLEVRDTGGGIEPALLPHVFDRFVKGDDVRSTGLGLAIARQLVVAHGGEISVGSPPGAGTTMLVRLPRTGG